MVPQEYLLEGEDNPTFQLAHKRLLDEQIIILHHIYCVIFKMYECTKLNKCESRSSIRSIRFIIVEGNFVESFDFCNEIKFKYICDLVTLLIET